MTGSITAYLILAALMVIVTVIRGVIANNDSKAQKEKEADQQAELKRNADMLESGANAHADAGFSSAAAVMKLDKTQRTLFYSTAGQNSTLSLSDIASVEFLDHSEDYKYCQEMARLHKGVERKSLYMPFGKHSVKEVREGFKKLDTYTGRLVYGALIRCKDGHSVTIPGYCGSGTLFWEEDRQMERFQAFLHELRKAL